MVHICVKMIVAAEKKKILNLLQYAEKQVQQTVTLLENGQPSTQVFIQLCIVQSVVSLAGREFIYQQMRQSQMNILQISSLGKHCVELNRLVELYGCLIKRS